MFHPSINRPNLLMGCDRELVLGATMISALFIFALMTWWSILIGVVLWPLATSMLEQQIEKESEGRQMVVTAIDYEHVHSLGWI